MRDQFRDYDFSSILLETKLCTEMSNRYFSRHYQGVRWLNTSLLNLLLALYEYGTYRGISTLH